MESKTVEESIASAMEDKNINLIKHYPYILQDFWEIGTSSLEVIKIIKKYKENYSNLSVLDLGSGKGAVSINISSELKCKCLGIDAIDNFVIFSNDKAKEYGLDNICTFETNDIRTRLKTLGKYDIIILGAIGPVFGDFCETLLKLSPHLNENGLIIMNEAYVEDGHKTDYPNVFTKSIILNQINSAGMEIIESIIADETHEVKEDFEQDAVNLEKRCLELIEKYPENKNMFLKYIENQKELYRKLDNEVIGVLFVIKKKM